jgi:hypothetical protein
MPDTQKKLLVFLSHASQDKAVVRELCERLRDDGFDPWLDEERLLPGQDWDLEIEKALRASDAILLCFSTLSVAKEGYIQREYKRAMRYQEEKPEGTIFVIPVRLDECEIPYTIQSLQFVDYPEGYDRLVMALNARAGGMAAHNAPTPKKEQDKSTPKSKQPSGKSNDSSGPSYNFNAPVTIGQFVGRDQTVYHVGDQNLNVNSPADFSAGLQMVQTQIAALKQQADLNSAQLRNLQAVEQKVAEAAEQATKPEPDGKSIKGALQDAKETIELLSGSIGAAVGLGTLLGNLIAGAVRLFGG